MKKNNFNFNRNFNLMVIGQIISLFANAILRFALPLYLLRETMSASIFALVTAISFIPMIILSIIGGILADRLNKRNIMIILDFSTAFIILILYFLIGKISIVPLFIIVLMLLYGISATYQPTVQASIPLLVDKEHLISANALVNLVGTLANLLGPIIGGILFGLSGFFPILITSIICFTISAIMEIFIYIPFTKRKMSKTIFETSKDDLKESYYFIKNDKDILFSISVIIAFFNLLITALIIVGVPILIIQFLKMTDFQLGISQAFLALGGLFGGILAGIYEKKLSLKNSYKLLIICSLSIFFIAMALFFNLSNFLIYIVLTSMCFFAMISATLFTIQIFSLVQSESPQNLVGKIISILIAISLSSQPIGQVIYGFLFEYFKNNNWIIFFTAFLLSLIISIYLKKILTTSNID